MSDETKQTHDGGTLTEPAEPPIVPPYDQAATPPDQPRVRDRVWSLRTVVAVAISAVALAGVGGAALAAAADGQSSGGAGQGGRGGFNPGRMQQFGQVPVPPITGNLPGQLPDATTESSGRDT